MAEGEQQQQGQEKTEEPTPRKREKAREKGQVPRSKELNTAALGVIAASFLLLFGSSLGAGMADVARASFTLERAELFDRSILAQHLMAGLVDGIWTVMPFFAVTLLVAAVSPLLLGGLAFSVENLQPKLEKLSPIKGLQKVFGPRGLMEFVKAFAKFVLLTGVAALLIHSSVAEFTSLGRESLVPALGHAAEMLGWSFLLLSLGLLLIAAVDVPFQMWEHTRQLRMTHQEVKDEMKDTEGRPEVRGQMRKRQRELAQGRMMHRVPDADVVITNPTHYAVALCYTKDMGAPRLVAKGTDLVALEIRRLAQANDVTIFESPALARMLHATTELEREIPADLYVAVAQVLAYVYRLDDARKQGDTRPEPPADLNLPETEV